MSDTIYLLQIVNMYLYTNSATLEASVLRMMRLIMRIPIILFSDLTRSHKTYAP